MLSKSVLLALALAARQAAATFDWKNVGSFNCPANTNTQCVVDQTKGFDWSQLSIGSFSQYASFNFDGWACADSFGGKSKRTLYSRTFQVCFDLFLL